MRSGNNKKVTIDVEFRAQVDQMKSGISNLQKYINGINFDPTRNANFKGLFQKFENEFSKMESRLNKTGDIFDAKELSGFEGELSKVYDLYTKIVKEIAKVTGMDDDALSKLIPQDLSVGFKKASEAIKQYEKDIKNAGKTSKEYIEKQKELKAVNDKKTGLNNSRQSLTNSRTRKNVELGVRTSELEDIQKELKKTSSEIDNYEKTIEGLQQKTGNLKFVKELEEANAAIEKFEKKKSSILQDKRYKSDESRQKAIDKASKEIGGIDSQIKKRDNAQSKVDDYRNIQAINEKEAELNALIQERIELENKLQQAQDRVNKTSTEIEEQTKEIENLSNAYAQADKEAEKLENEIKEIQEKAELEEFEKLKTKLSGFKIDGFDSKTAKNVEELKKQLESLGKDAVEKLKSQFPEIEKELDSLGITLKDTTKEINSTGNELDQLGEKSKEMEGFTQRLKYFFTFTNAVNLFKQALKQAYEEIQKLDAVMTETAVVTDFSVGDMWNKLPEYTTIANEYGASIQDAYEVMTIFYQQGLETNEVFALGEQTMQMARIAGLDYADAADKMTNALRGFNMELNETNAQRVTDVYSHLAAISASDTKELSTAMTKVASLANSANMEFENTAAFLAQMIETTRESAETAGTALKTVVARFSEVKKLQSEGATTGTDEDGEEIDVNKVGEALRSVGIDLNEFMSGAKGLDDILIELADKWDSLDLVTQRYIATMAAGSRQQSRFLALMNDNERLSQLTSAAYNAEGASAKQFGKTEESLAFKIQNLQNAYNSFVMGLSNDGVVKGIVDVLTAVLNGINRITKGIDGFGGSLQKLSLLMNVFSFFKTTFNWITEKSKTWGQDIANNIAKGIVNELGKQSKNIENAVEKAVTPSKSTGKTGLAYAITGKDSSGKFKGWAQEKGKKIDQKLQETKGYRRFLGDDRDFSGLDIEKDVLKSQDYSDFGKGIFNSIQKELNGKGIKLKEIEIDPKNALSAYEEIEKQLETQLQNKKKTLDTSLPAVIYNNFSQDTNKIEEALDNVRQKKEQLNNVLETNPSSYVQKTSESYKQLGQVLTGVSIAVGALEQKLADSFGEDNGFVKGISVFSSGLSTAATTTTMLGSSISGLAQVANNTTGALSSMAGALSGALAAAGPYIAAAMIIISVIIKIIEIIKKNKQATIDEAIATSEQAKSNKELLESYQDLVEAYKEGNASKEELENKSRELIDAYGIENGELLLMAENYEEIAKQAEKARKAQSKQVSSSLKQGADSSADFIKESKFGTDLKQITGIKYNTKLAELIQNAADAKGIEVKVKADDLTNINTTGLEDLSNQELLDFYNIVDSQINKYSNLYDDDIALSRWTDYQEKISPYLENIITLLSQIGSITSDYVEYDGATTFNSKEEYENWLSSKIKETKNNMLADGIDEDNIDSDVIKETIINAYADAGDKNMAFWKSVSELNNEELQKYINNMDKNSLGFNYLQSGKVSFNSDMSVQDLKNSIGQKVADTYISLGSTTSKKVGNYLSSLSQDGEASESAKSELYAQLKEVGLLDKWNDQNYEAKSYVEQSRFLEEAIQKAEEKTEDYYSFVRKELVSIKNNTSNLKSNKGGINSAVQEYNEAKISKENLVKEQSFNYKLFDQVPTQFIARDISKVENENTNPFKELSEGMAELISEFIVVKGENYKGSNYFSTPIEEANKQIEEKLKNLATTVDKMATDESITGQLMLSDMTITVKNSDGVEEEINGTDLSDKLLEGFQIEEIKNQKIFDSHFYDKLENESGTWDGILQVLNNKLEEITAEGENAEEQIEALKNSIDKINAYKFREMQEELENCSEKLSVASTNLKTFNAIYDKIDKEDYSIGTEDFQSLIDYNPELIGTEFTIVDGKVKLDKKTIENLEDTLEKQVKQNAIKYLKQFDQTYSMNVSVNLDEKSTLQDIANAFQKAQQSINKIKSAFTGLTNATTKTAVAYADLSEVEKKTFNSMIKNAIKTYNQQITNAENTMQANSDIADSAYDMMIAVCTYNQKIAQSYADVATAAIAVSQGQSVPEGVLGNRSTGQGKLTVNTETTNRAITDEASERYTEMIQKDFEYVGKDSKGKAIYVSKKERDKNPDLTTPDQWSKKNNKSGLEDGVIAMDPELGGKEYNFVRDNVSAQIDDAGNLNAEALKKLLDGLSNNDTGKDGDKEDDGSSALKSEQDLVNLERKRNKLEKEFQELQKGGIYTAGLQLANLEAQLAVLREEKKVQEQILEDKKLDFEKAKAKVKNVNELIDVNSDGSVTYSAKADALIKSGSLKGDSLENLQAVIETGNAVSDQETAIEDNMYQQAEVRSQQADVVNNVIDSVQQRVSELISTIGELVSSAYETIKAGLQATVDGFSNFLQRLNVIVDDSIDTESFKTSLDNLQKRNQWELEKIAEKNFTYNLKSVNSQVDLMSNINNQMQNAMTRLVTSQNSIANSYNQISYLQNDFTETLTNVGNGISSAITETVAAIDSVKKKLTDNVIGNFFSDVGSNILDKATSKIEGNKITSTLADIITGLFSGQEFEEWYNNYKENGSFFNWTDIDGNEYTENNMISQYIGIFTDAIEHLAPEYDYNYNKIDSSELLSLVQSKLELTQTVDDTYSGQLIKALLDYYQEAQDEMQTEVDNINSERQAILDAYDEITEILNTGKEQYGELSQAIYDAIVAEKQALLDELSSLNENISDADSKLIDTLKDNLDKIRQQRDNEEKETELQDKEARLAYLKQDTSGANRQEILKLEKELEDEKQDYTDTLIDQKISELEKQNEEAAEQRQIQIDLLQSEIDNTKGIWEQVNQLMEGLTDLEEGEIKQSVYNSIIKVLKKTDSFQNGSQMDQEDMLNNWEMLMRYASAYLYFDEGKGSSEYAYITAAKDLIDVTGGLPEGVTPGDGTTWEGYESVNALKDAVVDGDKDIKDAVDSVYTTVKDNMLTSEDFGKYMIAATRITGITTTISGSESIFTAFLDNITDKGPEVISKATEGAAKIVQAITKAGFTLADVPVDFWAGILSGDISGAISTLAGGMGEALGMAEEGLFDFIAAISDASLMGLGIVQDSMPAMADMVSGLADYAITSNKWDDTLEENEERKNKVNEVSLKLIEEAKARYGNNEKLVSELDKIYKEMEANKVDEKYTFGSTEALKYYKEIEYWIRLAARKEGNEVDQSLSSQFITTDSSGNIIKKNQEQKKEEEKGKENEEKENEDNNTDIWDKTVDKVSELNEKIKKASLGAGLIHADKLAFQDGDTWKSWEERIKKYAENGEITVDDIALVYSILKKWDKDNTIGISDELQTKLSDMASNLSNFSSSFWNKINIFFQRIGASIQAILKWDWDSLKEIWNYDYSEDKKELLQSLPPKENNNNSSSDRSGSDTKKSLIETISTAIKQAFGIDGSKTVLQKIVDKLKELWNALTNSKVGKVLGLPQFAKGGSISSSGIALTGEEGPEMNLHSDGTASLLGANGPEIANLKAGDQIYTAAQTRKLLSGKSFAINRYAEGTGALLAPITDLGATYLKENSTEINRENVFNFNLDLGNLTVDSPDRVNEVADKVWNKITTQVSSSIWPFNNL